MHIIDGYLKRIHLLYPVLRIILLQLSFNIPWALFLELGNALVISVKTIPLHVVLYISIATLLFSFWEYISGGSR
jgi:hypothetical protein